MTPLLRRIFVLPAVVLLGGANACHRAEVRVSLQPQDSSSSEASSESNREESAPKLQRPNLHFTWELPHGWTEVSAGQLSVASFQVKTDDGQAALVTITPLPNLSGREGDVVNMWRGQVGAPEVSADDARKALAPVDVAGGPGQLCEISGTQEGKPARIIVAFTESAESSCFYKISGDDALVTEQRPVFLEFLKSIHVQGGASASASAGGKP